MRDVSTQPSFAVTSITPITLRQTRVLTTELLAKAYGSDAKHIQNNYARNSDRFEEGKHFFKLSGPDLANLRPSLRGLQISPKTRSMIFWTERGAARHAKMLETDMAWEVFEALEDVYFNGRAAEDANAAMNDEPERRRIRSSGKVVRLELTDAVQDFVKYATAQGSKSAEKYYINITKMEYKALFMVGQAVGKNFRDALTARQGGYLMAAETIAQKALREGIARGMHYKDIYQLAKERVEAYSGLLGKTFPGDDRPMLVA